MDLLLHKLIIPNIQTYNPNIRVLRLYFYISDGKFTVANRFKSKRKKSIEKKST